MVCSSFSSHSWWPSGTVKRLQALIKSLCWDGETLVQFPYLVREDIFYMETRANKGVKGILGHGTCQLHWAIYRFLYPASHMKRKGMRTDYQQTCFLRLINNSSSAYQSFKNCLGGVFFFFSFCSFLHCSVDPLFYFKLEGILISIWSFWCRKTLGWFSIIK